MATKKKTTGKLTAAQSGPSPKSPSPKSRGKAPSAAPPAKDRAKGSAKGSAKEVEKVLAELKRLSSKSHREGLTRYAIPTELALGVPMNAMHALAKRIGKSHELAAALWKTECYEARTVAAFVDEPERITSAQMDQWARDFDSWAICDTVCFHLFDRTPHALRKIEQWSGHRDEFVKRAAFALLASVSMHNKQVPDETIAAQLPLVERAAGDERNFVKKAVVWALRSVGGRSPELHTQALELAERLATSTERTPRWIGKSALKELTSRPAKQRLEKKLAKASTKAVPKQATEKTKKSAARKTTRVRLG